LNKASLQTLIHLQAYAHARFLPQRRKASAERSADQASRRLGRGMDFAEFRPYQSGDEVRSIDWHVTARTGETHVRLYRKETEKPVFILVDQGESMQFGTQRKFKSVLAAEWGALLAWSAFKNHDRVGGVLIGVEDPKIILPRSGKFGVLNFLNVLIQAQTCTESHSEVQLDLLRPLIKSSSTICLISDFEYFSIALQDQLIQLSHYNEVLLVHVSDPLEQKAPPPGQYLVTDGNEELLLDTAAHDFCVEYASRFETKLSRIKNFCDQQSMDFYAIDTTTPWIIPNNS
jgi:uncharacterized protein (DUF58 family)